MSLDWPSGSQDVYGGLGLLALLIILLVVFFLGDDERRPPSRIRLASPAFVALDDESAEHVAAELGAAFREYIAAPRRGGRR